jgi:DNA polymerase-3 subunit gamma/tau
VPSSLNSSASLSDETQSAYLVLARKYRPAGFSDLIGQKPMVQTLSNAFKTGRLAQAYMLTGVRGVGKTTTARILARALNYQREGETHPQATLFFEEEGLHCRDIIQGRHVDVIEMDAASHNGVDDIRDIVDAARYKPVSARYKIYILDEVHMLSKPAFNALLKTLEEPPAHVKFIFATTEIHKVPVTILSRCQRFDLRRIETGEMVAHLRMICDKEGVKAEDDALTMLARASEGSVRDALSLLDQAMALGGTFISSDDMRAMLGLADRLQSLDLFYDLVKGDIKAALALLSELYHNGADPVKVLSDLADLTHLVTCACLDRKRIDQEQLSSEERKGALDLADKLSLAYLSQVWQMLIKGLDEVSKAPKPLQAADMVLVRIAHAAHWPSPDKLLDALQQKSQTASAQAPGSGPVQKSAVSENHSSGQSRASASSSSSEPAHAPASKTVETPHQSESVALGTLQDFVDLADRHNAMALKVALERCVRLHQIKGHHLSIGLTDDAPPQFVGQLTEALQNWTGQRWIVSINNDTIGPTLHEQASQARAELLEAARHWPQVQEVLKYFPDATICNVTPIAPSDPEGRIGYNSDKSEDQSMERQTL